MGEKIINKKPNILPAITFILVIAGILIIVFIQLFGNRFRINPMPPVISNSIEEVQPVHLRKADTWVDDTFSKPASSTDYNRISHKIHGPEPSPAEIEKQNYFRRIHNLLHTRISKSSI